MNHEHLLLLLAPFHKSTDLFHQQQESVIVKKENPMIWHEGEVYHVRKKHFNCKETNIAQNLAANACFR